MTRCLISPLDNGAASTYNWELAGASGLINGRDAMLLLLAGWRFSYWGATANQRVWADWLAETKQCFFLEWLMEGTVSGWTDQQQSHDASSFGWWTVRLVTCNGELACEGGLIDGGKTMLFLGMITGGNTMLLLLVTGGMIDGRDTALLLLDGWRFGCLRAIANQREWADWLMAATRCFFLVWSTAATQHYF